MDPILRERMIREGLEYSNKFSWEKTARQTLKILKDVAVSRKK